MSRVEGGALRWQPALFEERDTLGCTDFLDGTQSKRVEEAFLAAFEQGTALPLRRCPRGAVRARSGEDARTRASSV